MITHSVQQGSNDWLVLRAKSDGTASELAAAAGKSKYQKRTELMSQKITGMTAEIDSHTQALFDKGHASEELARVLADEIIGDDFYPTTGTIEIDGMTLLASFDGITADDSIIFEHKLYNKKLADDVLNGCLDEHYTLQMDQQLLVSGAEKCLFMCSDGTKENMAWCWYRPEQEKLDNVVSIWSQFRSDLAEYVPAVIVEAPKAEAIMQLPALSIQVNGAISLTDNLAVFGGKLKSFIDGIDKAPTDDQGFANIEAAVKVLDNAEKALKQAEGAALAQVESVDEMRVTVAFYVDLARSTRLMLDKLVKTQKEAIKISILNSAVAKFAAHKTSLELEIDPIRLIVNNADFAGAMKNKRTLASLHDAVDAELAKAKISMDSIAKDIRLNLALFNGHRAHDFLFADKQHLVYKIHDDLKLLIESRITAHDKAEADKLEAQRLQIQAEATRKAEAEQAAKLEAERAVIREEERVKAEAQGRADRTEKAELDRLEAVRQMKERQNALNVAAVDKNIVIPASVKNDDGVPLILAAPDRQQLIDAIANRFSVIRSVAEDWLVNEFQITEAA